MVDLTSVFEDVVDLLLLRSQDADHILGTLALSISHIALNIITAVAHCILFYILEL